MTWTPIINPMPSMALSVLVALVPILTIFWALIIKKMKGHHASILATLVAFLIALAIYQMPAKLAVLATIYGFIYGLFPICWIIINALFLFNLTVKSGTFVIIKHFIASITPDRRLQVLLIAFSFGAFLEGTAGYGAPVAITAAMLAGLGFKPLYAAGICLIANTAPVAFGSVGIPISVLSQVSGLSEMAISQMVGRTLPVLSFVLPFYLITLLAGIKNAKAVLPAILVSGLSFAFLQWFSSNYLGPTLPDIIAGVGSMLALILFLKYWQPKRIWNFEGEQETQTSKNHYSKQALLTAFSPFLLLTLFIILWGLSPVKSLLDHLGSIELNMPGLHQVIKNDQGAPLSKIIKFNYLSTPGTAILIASLLALPIIKFPFKAALSTYLATLLQLKYAILTISFIMGFAYLLNDSGITLTLAMAMANTGKLFPFFAPILGWLGVFITGSDTSSNALFGKLQYETANKIGVPPLIAVAANASGGVVGKMISPQSIAVAAAGGGLIGQESQLLRFTIKHSLWLLFMISLLVFMQAYVWEWIVPTTP
jgi:lactate permease